MSKINKTSMISINYGLKMLAILAFGIMIMPVQSYGQTYGEGGYNYIYNTNYPVVSQIQIPTCQDYNAINYGGTVPCRYQYNYYQYNNNYQAPAPVVNFSVIQPTVVVFANQTNIPYNGTSKISWITTNATSCFASGGSAGWAGMKNPGQGAFFTGSLTASETYTMTCSNSFGSTSDSETITVRRQATTAVVTTPKPALTSFVLLTSSIDRNQPIVPTLDNTRPHPGDEINYTVNYQNIGTGAITNLVLQIALPQEVSYTFSNGSNPSVFGNTLVFNLGTLKANGQGVVTIRVLVRNNIPAGTNLNFPATLSYINPSNQPQSVSANVSAQVWSEPTVIVPVAPTITENVVPLQANVFGAGFLPENIFGWILLFILVLLLILIGKYLLLSNQSFPFSRETVTTVDQPSGKKTTTTTTY